MHFYVKDILFILSFHFSPLNKDLVAPCEMVMWSLSRTDRFPLGTSVSIRGTHTRKHSCQRACNISCMTFIVIVVN